MLQTNRRQVRTNQPDCTQKGKVSMYILAFLTFLSHQTRSYWLDKIIIM